MEHKRTVNRIISGFWILSLLFTVACRQPREMGRTQDRSPGEPRAQQERLPETQGDYAISEEAVAALDARIMELNQQLMDIHEEITGTDRQVEESVRESWDRIEEKRMQVNENIDRYNTAVEEERTEEASATRKDINRLLAEIEKDISVIRDVFAREDGVGVPTPN
jgi:chromosome segregation ATPase